LNLFYQPAIAQGVLYLDPDESRHAVKVLRMQMGDTVELTDGYGFLYRAFISDADQKKCSFTIVEKKEIPARAFGISIAIAPTKNMDRTEWFVEKAVEIGVEKIHLLACKNSERKTLNLERLTKIAVSAMKQSGQARLPYITDLIPFSEMIAHEASQKFICYVDVTNPDQLKLLARPNQSYLVLIGPEGDFNKEEIQLAVEHGFKKVSLGPNRLRTETAALTACQILNFVNL
jgi:16S rRNA (uracil1498-N3)-methyltransferase